MYTPTPARYRWRACRLSRLQDSKNPKTLGFLDFLAMSLIQRQSTTVCTCRSLVHNSPLIGSGCKDDGGCLF
jgi:hypothetical protein